MLHSIEFENCFSFKGKHKISFEAGKRVSDDNGFIHLGNDKNISKITAVFGANASGKSNFLKIIAFIARFITEPMFMPAEIPIFIDLEPFLFSERNSRSYIKVIFSIEGTKYSYTVRIDHLSNSIIKEELWIIHETGRNPLFIRKVDPSNRATFFEKGELSMKLNELVEVMDFTYFNSCFVNVPKLKDEHYQNIIAYWNKFHSDIDSPINEKKGSFSIRKLAEHYHENEEVLLLAKKIAKNLGLKMTDVFVKKISINDDIKNEYILFSKYKNNAGKYNLPFFYESSGTKHIFNILKFIIPILNNGGIIVLDELDVTLHPHLIPSFLNLFKDKNINKNDAQLIFACHSIDIMNELDKKQILFVEKNEELESEIYSLNDFKGVRRFDNFAGKYNAGVYGAIPEN